MFSDQLPGTAPGRTLEGEHVPTTPPDSFHNSSPSPSLVPGGSDFQNSSPLFRAREAGKHRFGDFIPRRLATRELQKHGATFRRLGDSHNSYNPVT